MDQGSAILALFEGLGMKAYLRNRPRHKKKRRSSHQTQWAAQFAVASELCKRGYWVSLTLGNQPDFDLMVTSPNGVHFSIDVKGQRKPQLWPIKPKQTRDNLFYVLVLVPHEEVNQFFILTQGQVNEAIQTNLEHAIERRNAKGLASRKPEDFHFPGVEQNSSKLYRDRWDALPR